MALLLEAFNLVITFKNCSYWTILVLFFFANPCRRTDNSINWVGKDWVVCLFTLFSPQRCDYWHTKNKIIKKPGNTTETTEHTELMRSNDSSTDTLQFSKQHDPSELPIFDFGTILDVTNHFSPTNKLGQGGFGSVYKVIAFFLRNNLVHYNK